MEPRIEPPTDEDVASFDSEEPTEVMPERPPMSTRGESPAPAPADSKPAIKAAAPSKPARPAPPSKPTAAPVIVTPDDDAESKDRAYVAPRPIPRAAVPDVPAAQPRIVLNVAAVAPAAQADDEKVREQRRRRAPTLKIERGTLAAREADAVATLPEGIPVPMPPPAFVAPEPKLPTPSEAAEVSVDVELELDASPPKPSRAPWIVAAVAVVAALGALMLLLVPRLSGRSATDARDGAKSDAPALGATPKEPGLGEAVPTAAPLPSAEPQPAVEPTGPAAEPAGEPALEASSRPDAVPTQAPVEVIPPVATTTAAPRPVAPTSTYRPRPAVTSKKSDVPREI